jgi:eukaryotic-like serine/threonine-protein kinase
VGRAAATRRGCSENGAASEPQRDRVDPRYPRAVTLARSFGRYRVTGTLGTGAMGEVYAAVDDVLGRDVAVKTLRGNASGLAARILDDRFRQEARAIAALHHPSIVQVFDIDLSADPPYLVMERVAGPTLKDRLREGALTANALRALGIQIARALAAAHAAGIVHRDVKPANILAAGADSWKLADFGVAHVPDSSITMTGQFVGSPAYAPPEALIRGQSGVPGDVYGLGATLYEAAAGRWPRTEDTSGALLAPLPPLGELAPALPSEVAAVIDRAVSIEPDQRPSAAELADALAGAASQPGIAPVAVPPTPAPPAAPAGAFRWKPWAVGGAVVLAIALFALARGGAHPGKPIAPIGATVSDPRPVPPTEIRVAPPAGMDGKQTRDWNKIFDELAKGHFEGARHKLEEFEDHYGETDQTQELRAQIGAQIDALGPDVGRGPDGFRAPDGFRSPGGSHGRGKKHHD